MKKIFTLIFSLGLLTSASFAQSGYRQQGQNTGKTHQSSQYSQSKNYDKNNANAYSYGQNSQWNKNDNRDQYAFNRDDNRFDHDKKSGNRYDHFDSRNKKEKRDYDYAPKPVRIPLLQIIFSIGRK